MKSWIAVMSICWICSFFTGCSDSNTPQAATGNITTIRVASGLALPTFVIGAPNDTSRLFILEQSSGLIHLLKNGQLASTPFLDLSSQVSSDGGERGLLGLAFHPNFTANGWFYVNYIDKSGNTVVARYHATPGLDTADPNSQHLILHVTQPYPNHNGGMLAFGADGYLYIGLGDGGSEGDPGNRSQNGQELLGKMLRIDVTGGDPYAIPPNNPFVNNAAMRPEIWALGLRNPWRYSFDRATGDLYIADVGWNDWEEIDVQLAGQGGQNYGWRIFEGNHATGLSGLSQVVPNLTAPVYQYNHSGGNCAVTGGYVYRGSALPELQGLYFFADYCSARIWTLRWSGGAISDLQERTAQLAPGGGLSIGQISSFGQDSAGELYLCDQQHGEVYKIVLLK